MTWPAPILLINLKLFPMNFFKRFAAIALIICATAAAWAESATFTAASYNLRQKNSSDSVAGNGWARRMPVIANLIQFHGFDIFGTQEGFKGQLEGLKALMPGYEYIGIGRDDGKEAGEHSAIFYRPDTFELLDHGDSALRDTRQTRSWLGCRMCSYMYMG